MVAYKSASLGGTGNDTEFENAFANIAQVYLRDKAPKLMPYQIGFQIVEKDPDANRGVGIAGFKAGDKLIYCPLFFLKGRLKGHEMMYLHDDNQFVPLNEAYLNDTLGKKPQMIGEGVNRSEWRKNTGPINMLPLAGHGYKYSSEQGVKIAEWAMPCAIKIANVVVEDNAWKGVDTGKTLLEVIKAAGAKGVEFLCETFLKYPKLGEYFDKTYGYDKLAAAIDGRSINNGVLGDRPEKAKVVKRSTRTSTGSVLGKDDPLKTGALRILYRDKIASASFPDDLNDTERETLIDDDFLIQDHRDEGDTSLVYDVDERKSLGSPPESGIYEVFTKDGEFEKCVVVLDPISDIPEANSVMVIPLDDKKRHFLAHSSRVLVKLPSGDKFPNKEYKEWIAKQSDISLGSSGMEDSWRRRFVLFTPDGKATAPFSLESDTSDGDRRYYDVRYHDWPDFEAYSTQSPYGGCHPCGSGGNLNRIVMTDRPIGTLQERASGLYVPATAKMMRVDQADTTKWAPGDLNDLRMAMTEKTAELKVVHHGSEVWVNDKNMTAKSAIVHLVARHGLREDMARTLIKEAELASSKSRRCRIKYADFYSQQNQQPSGIAPSFPERPEGSSPFNRSYSRYGDVQTEYHAPMEIPFDQPYGENQFYDYGRQLLEPTMQVAMDAAETGQKEVFDTAMIGSLLKTVREDSMIDEHLPVLMKAMDAVARLMVSFYWHQDKFEERYGKSDMVELEDSLRNVFENIGDLILFLKQKTIRSYPEENVADLQHAAA